MDKILRQAATFVFVLVILMWVFTPTLTYARTVNIKGLDTYIKKTMKDWQVPGLGIALVKNDKVVFMQGYGIRKLGETRRVDENTIFPIGSASKAFTSTAIGLLVQDKKLSWDDRVVDHLQGFQMYDPWVTREITVRDLLCNRGGLSAVSDLLWYATDYDRDEIVRRLRYIEPESSFRSQYAYRNCMFLTAGQIIPAVTDMSWDVFLKERIFKPLGMNRSFTSVQDLQKIDNVATPHLKMNGKVTPVPFRNIDNVGPAGSVNASIEDMARWLRFHLADGMYDGKRIADGDVIRETHKPHTPISLSREIKSAFPWARRFDYCLSWVLVDYDGELCVYHNGEIDGIYAVIGFIPEKQVGVVVLTNYENQKLSDVLFLRAMDVLLERTPKDWNDIYLKNQKKQEATITKAQKALEASRVRETKPSLALVSYTGTYENDILGKIKVILENNNLVMYRSSILVSDLTHWHYDTFRAVCRDRAVETRMGQTFITFRLNSQGGVSEVNMGDMLNFKRLPDSKTAVVK
ncbi:MAG: serine hydrolase [Syntrophales bacterium]|nr:serine hydrolase [Syntrophales bacterium]